MIVCTTSGLAWTTTGIHHCELCLEVHSFSLAVLNTKIHLTEMDRRYTESELAVLFTYPNYCLENGLDYSTTLTDKLKPYSRYERSSRSVRAVFIRELKKYGEPDPSYSLFLKLGTKYFGTVRPPARIRVLMDQQLLAWGLSGLEETTILPSSHQQIHKHDALSAVRF